MKLATATLLTALLATPAFAQATNPTNNPVTPPTGPNTTMGANTATNVPATTLKRDDDDDFDWGWLGLLGLAGLAGLMPRKSTAHHVDTVSPGVNRTTTR